MNEELKALEENNIWTSTTLPPDKQPVGAKCVYKVKYNSSGSLERYKGRFVFKGYTQ